MKAIFGRRSTAMWPAALVIASGLMAPSAQAAWPADKPIRLIVPYGAGGASDTLGRVLAKQMGDGLKQTIVVENKPGAGSMLGSQFVARAAPDGYTLLLGSISNVLNNYFYKEPLYNIRTELAPVGQMVSVPNYLAVNKSVPAKSVAELVALAKSKPESLSCSTSGIGSSPYLSCELFKVLSGAQIVNVPFKSGMEAIQATIGGQSTMFFANEALPFIKAGQVRALGVTTKKRSSFLPDVPAIAETLPGYDVTAWYGVWAPAGTPPEILQKVSEQIARMMKNPEALKTVKSLGAEPAATGPAAFGKYVEAELDRWQTLTKKMNVKPN